MPRIGSTGCSDFAYPRLDEYEATLRAALLQAMDQWSRRRAGTLGDEAPIVRGNRKAVLYNALAPLRGKMAADAFDRLRQSLSLVFGTEAFVVLKDIWGLDGGPGARRGDLVGARAGPRRGG